jgi:hypothetical protein
MGKQIRMQMMLFDDWLINFQYDFRYFLFLECFDHNDDLLPKHIIMKKCYFVNSCTLLVENPNMPYSRYYWKSLNSKQRIKEQNTNFSLPDDGFEGVHDESNGIDDGQHPNPSI